MSDTALLASRRAGVLLHLTSLPSRFGLGDMGHEAYRFVEFLSQCGFGLWQLLPIGPTHGDLSPYNALSVHAGNPHLISLDWLRDRGMLDEEQLEAVAQRRLDRQGALAGAAARFRLLQARDPPLAKDFRDFESAASHWLEDYALYVALREENGCVQWHLWPAPLRDRGQQAMDGARTRLAERVQGVRFEQYVFERQLRELREYALRHGVFLFGDMPIFVAHDSADVWAHQDQFRLDRDGLPTVVTGVPPDYFNAEGQLWGNPHYAWERMRSDGFAWWLARLKTQRQHFDLLRLDHFRGFESCWEIPRGAASARHGCWAPAPGRELLNALQQLSGPDTLVAENLGMITPAVEQLRLALRLPGMLVLQFGFDGRHDNPHLPHNHEARNVVYSGTHDNDTVLGWYHGLDPATRARVDEYFCAGAEGMPWPLLRAALASVARLAILPMQDLLELEGSHRMNLPGSVAGNWLWQFSARQLGTELLPRVRRLLAVYGRLCER